MKYKNRELEKSVARREEARSEISDAKRPVTTPTAPAYSRAVRRPSPPA